jgi:hypothetical protein
MKKRTVKILTGIAIVIIVLGIIYAIAVSISSAKLRRAYADLKKDGRPMLPGLLIPQEVSDTENAALLYECAAQLLRAQSAPENTLLYYLGNLSQTFIKESLDAEKLAELKKLIGQEVITLALSIVEQGTRRDLCRYDLNYDDGLGIRLNHIHHLRDLIRIGCAKAYIEAETGNTDTAWNMLLTQLKFADALRTEPVLISQLIRIQMIRLSCDTINKLCEIAPPNIQQADEIRSLLKDFDDIRTLIFSIDAERLLVGEWVFNLSKDEMYKANLEHCSRDAGLLPKLIIFGITFKPLFLADHAAYLRYMHEGAKFAERPYSPDEAEVLEKELQKKRHIVTSMLAPALFRVKQIHFEMTAELRIAQAGLALLLYKKNQGAFPDSLEALKLQDINDPFSDKTLFYKTEGEGFVLYSVGPDQMNNGGSGRRLRSKFSNVFSSPRQKKQEKDWDIVWHFPDKQ